MTPDGPVNSGCDGAPLLRLAEAIVRRRPLEVAWRVPMGGDAGSDGLAVIRAGVSGRAALRRIAGSLKGRVWAGELRVRLGGDILYTGLVEVAAWRDAVPLPAARTHSLWARDARETALREAFLSGLRMLLEDAGRRRVVRPRDALFILTISAAACRGPISRSPRDRAPGA